MHRLILSAPFLIVLATASLLCSCGYQKKSDNKADKFDVLCSGRGAEAADPCPISFITLAANPDLFDEKYVRVAGFYTKGLDHLLFSDKQSADAGIVANVVLISPGLADSQRPAGTSGHYILVKGKFIHAAPTKGELNPPDAKGLLGEMTSTEMVRGAAIGVPYECWGYSGEANNTVESANATDPACQ